MLAVSVLTLSALAVLALAVLALALLVPVGPIRFTKAKNRHPGGGEVYLSNLLRHIGP